MFSVCSAKELSVWVANKLSVWYANGLSVSYQMKWICHKRLQMTGQHEVIRVVKKLVFCIDDFYDRFRLNEFYTILTNDQLWGGAFRCWKDYSVVINIYR